MRIEHYEGLNRTPALPIALQGWYELFDRGLCDNVIMLFWDNNALVAFDDAGKAIGVITYQPIKHEKAYWINIGYVVPDWRNGGVYRELWDALVAKAQADKVLRIGGSAHPDNARMREIARKLGRREGGMTFNFDVLPGAESKP